MGVESVRRVLLRASKLRRALASARVSSWMCALFVLGAASAASGASITVYVSGTLAQFLSGGPSIESDLSIGDPISASFSYDPDTADSQADPGWGRYSGAVSQVSGTYGSGFTFGSSSLPTGEVNVTNDWGASTIDQFQALSGFVAGLGPALPVSGEAPVFFGFAVHDPTAAVFSSDALPTSLDLADFDTANTNLSYVALNFDNGQQARFTVTSMVFVPEPATVLLLAGGLMALTGCRKVARS
jgi:hypothetical protein